VATGAKRGELSPLPGAGNGVLTDDALIVPSGAGFHNFEWYTADGGKQLWTAGFHHGSLTEARSPRGGFLLVLEGDSSARLLRTDQRGPLDWSVPRTRFLAMSEDERTVAGQDLDDFTIKTWDVATRRLLGRYRGPPGVLRSMAFSPDGRCLAVANGDGEVYEIDVSGRHCPDGLHLPRKFRPPLVWTPDSQAVAAADDDGAVWLFDPARGAMRALASGPHRFANQPVSEFKFSPDGRTLAVVWQHAREVVLLDQSTGRRRSLPRPGSIGIARLAFSPDGRTLAEWSKEGVQVYDVATGRVLGGKSARRTTDLGSLAFSPDGRFVVMAFDDTTVLDLSGGPVNRQALDTIRHNGPVFAMAVSPDGRTVAEAERGDGPVRLRSLSPDGRLGRDTTDLHDRGDPLYQGLSFSRDGKSLLAMRTPRRSSLWSLPDRSRYLLYGETKAGALSPDGRSLAVLWPDGALEVYDVSTWRVRRPEGSPLGPVQSLAFSPDGATLLTGCRPTPLGIDRESWTFLGTFERESAPLLRASAGLRFWDLATGREVPSGLPDEEVMALPSLVAWSNEGLVAAAAEDGSVRVWDRGRGNLLARRFLSEAARSYTLTHELWRRFYLFTDPNYDRHTESPRSLAFSPDGRWLAMAGNRGSVVVWDTRRWEVQMEEQDPSAGAEGWVAFTPDGARLAVARGGQVQLWDVAGKRALPPLGKRDDAPVRCGAIAPKGDLLATGASDCGIRLWDLATGELLKTLAIHRHRPTALAFSPDGKTLASAGLDRVVRLTSMATRQEVAVLPHEAEVSAVNFSPDGQTLATATEQGEVWLRRIGPAFSIPPGDRPRFRYQSVGRPARRRLVVRRPLPGHDK
jgi:WD40 repeat protein